MQSEMYLSTSQNPPVRTRQLGEKGKSNKHLRQCLDALYHSAPFLCSLALCFSLTADQCHGRMWVMMTSKCYGMEKQTGSKLGKEYVKTVYFHFAYLTSTQSPSCEMPGWMKLKLESRLPGEISITSNM